MTMATYAATKEDVLSLVQMRKSANLMDGDTAFDAELILHRDAAVDYVEAYLNRPLVRRTETIDIFWSYGCEPGQKWMQKHVPDYIAVMGFHYVSEAAAALVTPDTTVAPIDLEAYYQADNALLKVYFRSIPNDIKRGSPLLWSIDMGVDYDLRGGDLIKGCVEAYAKGLFLGANVEVLTGYVKGALENHRSDYELSFVTSRDLRREWHDQEVGYGQ